MAKTLLIQTAEAKIYKAGKKVFKERIRKGYRNLLLDKKIKRERTKAEARILGKLHREGLKVPQVLSVNLEKGIIEMEFIKGKRLKDVFDGFSQRKKNKICKKLGRDLGVIHNLNIIHGDVTLANIIKKGEDLFWLDFGLARESSKIEDFAVDLLVFKRTFLASHLNERAWKEFEKGYLEEKRKAKEVLKRVKIVEKRARYL
jgi:Kae1-associated kinase Bud32